MSNGDNEHWVKLAVDINEHERLELPLPAWVHEKGKRFWLLGMNVRTLPEDPEAIKVEMVLSPRTDTELLAVVELSQEEAILPHVEWKEGEEPK